MNCLSYLTAPWRCCSIGTVLCVIALSLMGMPAGVEAKATRSTNIALTSDGSKLVAVNTDANSVTVFAVAGDGRSLNPLAEIPVGNEPYCVAINGNSSAYVTNGASRSVWVIDLNTLGVSHAIRVGYEPRGCALTPDGNLLYVANHTTGSVSVIDTASKTVVRTIKVGGNPMAIAITNIPVERCQPWRANARAGSPR